MYVISDDGNDVVDLSACYSIGKATISDGPEQGTNVLLVQGGRANVAFKSIIVKGGEHRVDAGLRDVVEALERGDAILDMRKAVGVGDRPKVTLAVQKLAVPTSVRPNGGAS